jgi:serine/threonine-protein kinase
MAYMSPEQKTDSSAVTSASDIYSLGVILFEVLTGQKPLGHFKAPSELNASLPEELDAIVFDCLDPAPEARPTAEQLVERLLHVLRGGHLEKSQVLRAGATVHAAGKSTKYALLDVIKEDAYSAVYLYEDPAEHRLFVTKKLPPSRGGVAEAKLLVNLRHPNIVRLLGTTPGKDGFVLLMEYMAGGNLQDRMLRPMEWPEAARVMRDVCEALSFAHRNRIIHGNLRPSNVLFTPKGEVKVADFAQGEHYAGERVNWYNERAVPHSVAADLLAAGTILYQMVTATIPMGGAERLAADPYLQRSPRELHDVLESFVSGAPGKRFETMDDAVRALDRLLGNAPAAAAVAPGGFSARTWMRISLLLALLLASFFLFAAYSEGGRVYRDLWRNATDAPAAGKAAAP